MVVSPLFELLFSSKTILQKRVPCRLTPHTPETTITLNQIKQTCQEELKQKEDFTTLIFFVPVDLKFMYPKLQA
jgi:hypothetical protein